MTLTIELTPEEEERLQVQAQAQGVDVNTLLRGAIQPLLMPITSQKERPFYETATPEERAAEFLEWAASHPRDTPLLSDEAISRESIYGERG